MVRECLAEATLCQPKIELPPLEVRSDEDKVAANKKNHILYISRNIETILKYRALNFLSLA